jgi:hypothetical protein
VLAAGGAAKRGREVEVVDRHRHRAHADVAERLRERGGERALAAPLRPLKAQNQRATVASRARRDSGRAPLAERRVVVVDAPRIRDTGVEGARDRGHRDPCDGGVYRGCEVNKQGNNATGDVPLAPTRVVSQSLASWRSIPIVLRARNVAGRQL